MRWLLAGCCGFIFIHFSVAASQNLQVYQAPRFYGVTTGHQLGIYCIPSKQHIQTTAQWYKATSNNPDKTSISLGGRIFTHSRHQTKNAILVLSKLHVDDQGIYFCKINDTWGPGTELQVAERINIPNALYRSQMKDGLIALQGLLLAFCIAAILRRRQTVMEKRDSIYEEPETDHIYEGLAIETCQSDLYEDLAIYADADGTEAPWE